MWVPEEQRSLYHAGLAHGANHLVTLVAQAMELLSAAGADDPAAILRPLLERRARQRADRRRRGADRADRPRRREHRARPPRRDRGHRARHAAVVRRPGARHARPRRHRRPGAADPRRRDAPGARRGRGRRRRPAAGSRRRRCDDRDPLLVASTREELDALLAPRRRAGEPVVLVPTMGALHAGPRGAAPRRPRAARCRSRWSASIFVNPLQFAPGEDLDRYPRTLDADLELCADAGRRRGVRARGGRGVPRRRAAGHRRARAAGAAMLEGASRPGHFRGVLTVVAKLFGLVRPDRRGVRGEGLPAAGAGPADEPRPVPRRRGGRVPRPCARPTGWRCPAATATSTPSSVAWRPRCRGRCGRRRTTRRTAWRRRGGAATACWTPSRSVELDYLDIRAPDLGEVDAAPRPDGPGSWWPPGSGPPG